MKKILIALNGLLVVFPSVNNINGNDVVIIENHEQNEVNEIQGPININFASASRLTQIEGISEKIANAIVEHRESRGLFKTIEQIKDVNGIGPVTFEKIKGKICV